MITLCQVDAFSAVPFKGNPAGVCVLERVMPDEWMLHLAEEMNLSETAFVLKKSRCYSLRWFTPKTEVSLCGHATLATAHILWELGILKDNEEAVFETKSGILRARKEGVAIEMDFPARIVEPIAENRDLNRSLGVSPVFTGLYAKENGNVYLLEVETDRVVKEMSPDFGLLLMTDARAVIVTSRSTQAEYDFISRFFAPAVGINEDPVTGSAHCYLTPYWTQKMGKTEMKAFQASRRTGEIGCRLMGDRVVLQGQAVTIFRAELMNA